MNNNYPRFQITSKYEQVSTADWYFAQPEIAVDRGDIYVGFAALSIAQSGKAYLQMKTNGGDIYLLSYGVVTDSVRTTEKIIEAPSLTDGTTPLSTLYNLNRQSTDTPGFDIYTNPTSVTGGTVIDQVEQYEAKKSLGVAGEAGSIRLKFKKATDYVLELTNGDNNTKNYFVKFYMIEL